MQVVPKIVLDQLRCVQCKAYLSCGPMFLKTDGQSVCGRCGIPQKGAIRNKPYEKLAALLKFRCKNEPLGCPEILSFNDTQSHETICKFKPYECTISPDTCQWKDALQHFCHHCQTMHKHHTVQSPHQIRHNVMSGLQTLLLTAFNMLFLLKVHVCDVSKIIYHSVWFIGNPIECAYKFTLNIENERGIQVSQVGDVGQMNEEQDMSTKTSIEYLQSVLGTNEKITFIVAITKRTAVPCEKCTARELQVKLAKHKNYFCTDSIVCKLCEQNIAAGRTLASHYKDAHDLVTYKANSIWRITADGRWCIINAIFGHALCKYSLDDAGFTISVYTPLPCHLLHLFQCSVELMNPLGTRTLVRAAELQYNTMYDWRLHVPNDEVCFCVVNNKMDILIDFIKQ